MKFEIEIPEEKVKEVLQSQVHLAIRHAVVGYGIDKKIKSAVESMMPNAIKNAVEEAMQDHAAIKKKVVDRIEKILTAKCQAALKLKDKI